MRTTPFQRNEMILFARLRIKNRFGHAPHAMKAATFALRHTKLCETVKKSGIMKTSKAVLSEQHLSILVLCQRSSVGLSDIVTVTVTVTCDSSMEL